MKSIVLSNGVETLVDDDIYEYLNQWKWYLNAWGYAIRSKGNVTIWMHRLINQTPEGFETDHINHNKLDNRRCNLRSVTSSQNKHNRPKYKNNTSGYKGVSYDICHRIWKATIKFKCKKIHIGYYKDPLEASNAYQNKAKELFGEFAC